MGGNGGWVGWKRLQIKVQKTLGIKHHKTKLERVDKVKPRIFFEPHYNSIVACSILFWWVSSYFFQPKNCQCDLRMFAGHVWMRTLFSNNFQAQHVAQGEEGLSLAVFKTSLRHKQTHTDAPSSSLTNTTHIPNGLYYMDLYGLLPHQAQAQRTSNALLSPPVCVSC